MKKYFTLVFICVLFVGCSSKNNLDFDNLEKKEQIFSNKKAQNITLPKVVDQIEPYDIIFVGDHHNTKKTHEFFNSILKELIKKGYKIHLANEWFSPSENRLLEDYTLNKFDSDELNKRKNWKKFSRYDWKLSSMLYETVKKGDGKLYVINISKENRKKISLRQFDKMSKEEKDFYDSLDLNVSAHEKLVKPYLEHCSKMPSKSKENCVDRMYRVQVTWDTYMANETYKLSKEVLKTPKDKLIVFVGAFHIEYNLGIPLRFSRLSNTPFTTISNYQLQKEEEISIPNNLSDIVYIYEK